MFDLYIENIRLQSHFWAEHKFVFIQLLRLIFHLWCKNPPFLLQCPSKRPLTCKILWCGVVFPLLFLQNMFIAKNPDLQIDVLPRANQQTTKHTVLSTMF